MLSPSPRSGLEVLPKFVDFDRCLGQWGMPSRTFGPFFTMLMTSAEEISMEVANKNGYFHVYFVEKQIPTQKSDWTSGKVEDVFF